MSWKEVFTEKDQIFSWRKTLTGIAAILFITACIVYWAGGRALPQEYMIIISGVLFYFLLCWRTWFWRIIKSVV